MAIIVLQHTDNNILIIKLCYQALLVIALCINSQLATVLHVCCSLMQYASQPQTVSAYEVNVPCANDLLEHACTYSITAITFPHSVWGAEVYILGPHPAAFSLAALGCCLAYHCVFTSFLSSEFEPYPWSSNRHSHYPGWSPVLRLHVHRPKEGTLGMRISGRV